MNLRLDRTHARGFAIVALLFVIGSFGHPASAQSIAWDRLADGLAIGVWDPAPHCKDVPPLLVSDIDPLRYRVSVHYFRNERFAEPPDIHEWQRRTGHDLVFNAGLFRENFSYLGLLYGQGKSLGGKRHASWMGLFVAEPIDGGVAQAGILDLSVDSFDEQRPSYGEAAQALMLLDRNGQIRVKQSGKQAQQTIVGELQNGHILIMKTTEAASLHAIGQCLHDAYPQIRQAMAMDGGSSSDLSISPTLQHAIEKTAGAHSWRPLLNGGPTGHIGLPAVIGISPRRSAPHP
ncbi:MAG TPA: phosphodiester glycosidase family protein [Nitrospira sp.]|jgi:uncharacterized protein YigE (DUF2233 family)|nr:phosphodiester glycosidase family protein [Nitrospira sp.]